jgi:thymidylate synthase (FAD)
MDPLNDGISLVILEDTWGSEGRICDTARLSASDRRVEGQELDVRDKSLLKNLLFGSHGTPFETLYFRWRLRMPIFVARQLVKHRMSSWNEMSRRYRGKPSPFFIPKEDFLMVEGFPILDKKDLIQYETALNSVQHIREELLKSSYGRIEKAREEGTIPPDTKDGRDPWRARARELVRGIQPVSEYTEVIWTLNFRSLMNILFLRTDQHTQQETRMYANAMENALKQEFPYLHQLARYFIDNQIEFMENLNDTELP